MFKQDVLPVILTKPEEAASTIHSSDPQTHAMEHWISYVLRYGVLASALIILVGGAIFLLSGPAPRDPHSLHQLLQGNYSNRSSLHDIARGLKNRRGLAVVDLGLIVLILTPVVRVAMTFVLFAFQKDRTFSVITAIVFAILVAGLAGVGV